MRQTAVLLLVAFLLASPGFSQEPDTEEPENRFGLEEVVEAVKREIDAARQVGFGAPRLQIDVVELTLSTQVTRTLEGGLRFSIAGFQFGVEGGMSPATTQKISLTLKPEGAIIVGAEEDMGLARAVREVKAALRKALATEPRLGLDEFVYEFHFAVKRKVGGGISFAVVDLGEISQERADIQTIRIKFTQLEP